MVYTCYQCGKRIKSKQVVHSNPPLLLISLGIDFPKAYHPSCFKRADAEAAKELFGEKVRT